MLQIDAYSVGSVALVADSSSPTGFIGGCNNINNSAQRQGYSTDKNSGAGSGCGNRQLDATALLLLCCGEYI
jgi:hypothetical protein